ncbi:hypothetical protein DM01DRAFT_1331879 [Hesseltinella vesiculosa]|uniref:Uncharacterized protein n=1 Tax=Hesseltinella vesiculosa TaxID=101127 RepID=A0A1X2GWS3_9FUNG|nr:hypothetical protein DM01DRAFT_1331879 [Hesseltinella vesiculosa]
MDPQFYFEDGFGNVYDEDGCYAIGVEMRDEAAELASAVSLTTYNATQTTVSIAKGIVPKKEDRIKVLDTPKNSYSLSQRYRFIWLMEEKLMSAAAAACHKVSRRDLYGFIKHSENRIEDCINGVVM